MNERRTYVPLADVAAACGIPAFRIQTRHFPEDWAVPRDYRLLPPHYTCLVAEGSLPQLVERLRVDGFGEAADRLDSWRAEIAAPETHEEFTARHGAVARLPADQWWQKGQYA